MFKLLYLCLSVFCHINDVQNKFIEIISPPVKASEFKQFQNIRGVDIKSESNLHLRCELNSKVIFTYPTTNFDYRKGFGNLTYSCVNSKSKNRRCWTEYILNNITYEYTGPYGCKYIDREDYVDQIYLFINDPFNLLVPYLGVVGHISVPVVQNKSATIPCLPTSTKVNVILRKLSLFNGSSEFSPSEYTFDPTIGFRFHKPHWDTWSLFLHCIATLDDEEEISMVEIDLTKLPSYRLKPLIEASNAFNHFINGTLTLVCQVSVETGVGVTMIWDTPNHDSRVIYSKPKITHSGSLVIHSMRLTIYPLIDSDEGTYYCNVSDANYEVYSVSHYIQIGKTPPPSSVNFSIGLNQKTFAQEIDKPFILAINVHAVPTIDSAVLHWYKDNKFLGDARGNSNGIENSRDVELSHYKMFIDKDQSLLSIDKLSMFDTGTYTLQGKISNYISNISVYLKVIGPPAIQILRSYKYFPFHPTIILCRVIGTVWSDISWGFSPCIIASQCSASNINQWSDKLEKRLNNETILPKSYKLSPSEIYFAEDESKPINISSNPSYVVIKSLYVNPNVSGIYRCFSRNDRGSTFANLLFIVTEAEDGFSLALSTKEPVEGDTFNLTCKASSFNYTQLTWSWSPVNSNQMFDFTFKSQKRYLFDKSSLIGKVKIYQWTSYHTLTNILMLNDAEISNSGRFYCNATSKDSSKIAHKMLNLSVEKVESPRIVNSNMNNTIIEVDESTVYQFKCFAKGKPKPIINWYKNGYQLKSNITGIEYSDFKSKLIIRRLVPDDSGKYKCQASNRGGFVERFSTIKVKTANSIGLSLTSIMTTSIFIIFAIIMIVLAVFIGGRIRLERKVQAEFFAKNLFNTGQLDTFNPELPLHEQVNLLSYDMRVEFPEERLRLIRTLGEGAFGRVVLAEAIGLGEKNQLVAIKMLKPNSDWAQKKALIAELKILIHLGKHLNIVNCLGAVTKSSERGRLMVIVEYCPFGNLREFLYKQRDVFVNQISPVTGDIDNQSSNYYHLSSMNCIKYVNISSNEMQGKESNQQENGLNTRDLICYAFQVAKGMEYLEEKMLIHRDLAARNVLVAENGVLKICDFGLAKNIEEEYNYVKKTEGLLPIKWMAIESIGDRVFTIKSDVWSFGVLLWEIFTLGGSPYPGIDANQHFFEKLKSGYRMTKPEYCPNNVYKLMENCWLEKPKDRPNFAEVSRKLGQMIETSVVNYYLELNDTYDEANKVLDDEYLKMEVGEEQNEYTNMSQASGYVIVRNKQLNSTDVNKGNAHVTLKQLNGEIEEQAYLTMSSDANYISPL